MDDAPRRKLVELVAQYGPALSDDPKRVEGLLRDFCGQYKGEIFVLVSALHERVAADLLARREHVPYEVLLAQLARRLQENRVLTEEAACWAVESWALALGVIGRPSSPPAIPLSPSPSLPLTLRGHQGRVNSVACSPDGRLLASAGQDRTVQLWDAATGERVRRPFETPAPVLCVAFSADGRLLAWGGGDGAVEVQDVAQGERLHRLEGHAGEVNSVAFSPDGRLLAADSGDAIALWDVESCREIRQLKGHTHLVQSVAFSPDGAILASGGGDGAVRLWDVSSRAAQARRLDGHAGAVWSVAFSPDGRLAVSGGHDRTARLWDALNGQEIRRLEGHAGGVNCVAFSPDGRLLAAASSDSILLWDVARGRQVERLKGHTNLVQSVAFDPVPLRPRGWLLASGSWDHTARLWRVVG